MRRKHMDTKDAAPYFSIKSFLRLTNAEIFGIGDTLVNKGFKEESPTHITLIRIALFNFSLLHIITFSVVCLKSYSSNIHSDTLSWA